MLAPLLVDLQRALPAEAWGPFEQAQGRWDAYARADCEWKRSLLDGGSAGSSAYAACMNTKARQRIAELKLLLCEGYGLTGACEASARYDLPAD